MKAVYVLVILIDRDIKVVVGALGTISFEKGLYAYVGSAQGGLEKRVERHLREVNVKFWHIDYLLDDDAVKVVTAFYRKAEKSEECRIAERVNGEGVAIINFGCSDCGCISHLFKVEDCGFLRDFMLEMQL